VGFLYVGLTTLLSPWLAKAGDPAIPPHEVPAEAAARIGNGPERR